MLSICTFDVICAMSNSSTMLDVVDMTILDTARLHDMNTNLTQHRKITKIWQKTWHEQKNEHDTDTWICQNCMNWRKNVSILYNTKTQHDMKKKHDTT